MNDTGDALSAGCLCHVPLRVVERNTELLLCDVCLGCDGEVIGDGGEDDDGADEDGGEEGEKDVYCLPSEHEGGKGEERRENRKQTKERRESYSILKLLSFLTGAKLGERPGCRFWRCQGPAAVPGDGRYDGGLAVCPRLIKTRRATHGRRPQL